MKRLLLLVGSLCFCSVVLAADTGKFVGKVVVEWLDDDPFIPQLKLVEDFAFEDAAGKQWVAAKGKVLDGRSLPLLFREIVGLPFSGQYRKTSVIYDHYCQIMKEPWKDVHRMFYHASTAEGVSESEAAVMYAVLYAGGSRWEVPGSRCFSSCHAAAPSLTWRPSIEQTELKPVLDWINQTRPTLDEIDQRLDATLKRPGPHIFVQVR